MPFDGVGVGIPSMVEVSETSPPLGGQLQRQLIYSFFPSRAPGAIHREPCLTVSKFAFPIKVQRSVSKAVHYDNYRSYWLFIV